MSSSKEGAFLLVWLCFSMHVGVKGTYQQYCILLPRLHSFFELLLMIKKKMKNVCSTGKKIKLIYRLFLTLLISGLERKKNLFRRNFLKSFFFFIYGCFHYWTHSFTLLNSITIPVVRLVLLSSLSILRRAHGYCYPLLFRLSCLCYGTFLWSVSDCDIFKSIGMCIFPKILTKQIVRCFNNCQR